MRDNGQSGICRVCCSSYPPGQRIQRMSKVYKREETSTISPNVSGRSEDEHIQILSSGLFNLCLCHICKYYGKSRKLKVCSSKLKQRKGTINKNLYQNTHPSDLFCDVPFYTRIRSKAFKNLNWQYWCWEHQNFKFQHFQTRSTAKKQPAEKHSKKHTTKTERKMDAQQETIIQKNPSTIVFYQVLFEVHYVFFCEKGKIANFKKYKWYTNQYTIFAKQIHSA